jgi:hypothetical protein
VLGNIIGPRRGEVAGARRMLHNGDLHDFYPSRSIIRMIKSRKMKWVVHVAGMGEKKTACRTLVEKPEGKRPLGRQRHRFIEMNLSEIVCGDMDWIDLTQDREQLIVLMYTVMNHLVP